MEPLKNRGSVVFYLSNKKLNVLRMISETLIKIIPELKLFVKIVVKLKLYI